MQQPNRLLWWAAASSSNRGKRRVCNKHLYLVYKSIRNVGIEIIRLHEVNKGTVTLLRLHRFLAHRVLVPFKELILV